MKNRLLLLAIVLLSGCTIVSYDRVFPKLTWAWTDAAKEQRSQNRQRDADERAFKERQKTNHIVYPTQ